MQYDEALRRWGATKLAAYDVEGKGIDLSTISVEFDFDEGYACCGGSDPDCYCSFAESPSADVVVRGSTLTGRPLSYSMDADCFDFATVIRELCLVAGVEGITA